MGFEFVGFMGPGLASLGGRIKGTLGNIDPLNKVPLKESREPEVGFRRGTL